MSTILRRGIIMLFAIAILLPAQALAQGEDHGSGQGDLFGDLVHIKRDPATGQPILQKRWIAYPSDLYDWGYCPIPIDAQGNEIPFATLACEADPAYTAALVEVDYFGRLSGGRTRERNIRMHFDEVISKIKDAQLLNRDAAGRLMVGTGCTVAGGIVDAATCTWKTVDSPQENLAFYHRLMKYGHVQTDPLEIDIDFHGDPASGTQYHVALGAGDYPKFQGALSVLLPVAPAAASTCFGGSTFTCDDPLPLTNEDFVLVSSFLGGAADKTGLITPDLIQYLNRILKITEATTYSAATVRTVPALIRDCGPDPANPLPPSQCAIAPAPPGLPSPADELFVDYGVVQYDRSQWFNGTVDVIKPSGVDTWVLARGVAILPYLAFRNPGQQTGLKIVGFVNAGSDSLRAVEFMHEYEPPADLGWDFGSTPPPAAVTVTALTSDLSSPQSVGRTITFTATATGGVAPLQYKWWIRSGLDWQVAQAWSTSTTFVWTPTVAAAPYYIGVWVRSGDSTLDAPASTDAFRSMAFTILAVAPIRVVSLVSDVTSPQVVGSTVTFAAAAGGGVAPYQYKWWIFDGVNWSVGSDWSPSSTFAWTPTVPNPAYRIGVWVRSAGSTADTPESSYSYTSIPFAIVAPAGITVTAITPDKAAPQTAGTTIVFTASAAGGIAPYEYLYWLFDGATWTIGRQWAADPTFAWTPYVSNMGYRVGVWVRSAGSTQDTTPETPNSYLSIPYPITLGASTSTNNLSVPVVFAEGYGLTGLPTTTDAGLRPTTGSAARSAATDVVATWGVNDVFTKDQVAYYLQKSSSAWQADWRNGYAEGEHVVVDWSNGLLNQRWTPDSVIPVETTLYQNPEYDPMSAYQMAYLFGEGDAEMWGTDSTTFASNFRTVFAATARLTIERITGPGGDVVRTVPRLDTSAAQGFANPAAGSYGSVNTAGRLVYRYDWRPKQWPVREADKVGWWRLTFRVDPAVEYQLTSQNGKTSSQVVARNTIFDASDPGDGAVVETLRPRLVDPYTSVVEVELVKAPENR